MLFEQHKRVHKELNEKSFFKSQVQDMASTVIWPSIEHRS